MSFSKQRKKDNSRLEPEVTVRPVILVELRDVKEYQRQVGRNGPSLLRALSWEETYQPKTQAPLRAI